MRALIFHCPDNTTGKHDGDEFARCARAFAARHHVDAADIVPVHSRGLSYASRRAVVKGAFDSRADGARYDCIAFFCHGWSSGIQSGYNTVSAARLLAHHVARVAADEVKIILYCCSTADDGEAGPPNEEIGPATDGGFADALRDELAQNPTRSFDLAVYAHKTAGHCCQNPAVVVMRDGGIIGGTWLFAPGSVEWQSWRAALKKEENGLCYDFPFLTREEIMERIANA